MRPRRQIWELGLGKEICPQAEPWRVGGWSWELSLQGCVLGLLPRALSWVELTDSEIRILHSPDDRIPRWRKIPGAFPLKVQLSLVTPRPW